MLDKLLLNMSSSENKDFIILLLLLSKMCQLILV